MLLSLKTNKDLYHFVWQGSGFRHEGYLSSPRELLQALALWLDAYNDFCMFQFARIAFEPDSSNPSKNLDRDLSARFGELTEALNFWLRNSEDFWKAERKAERGSPLVLAIENNSILVKLPWEYCFLAEDYQLLSYSSPNLTRPSPSKTGKGILAALGKLGIEGDREILARHRATILENPDRDALCQSLRRCHWEIFYYGGHSDSEQLFLGEKIEGNGLQTAVRQGVEQGLKLAVFNACNGSGFIWLRAIPLPATIIWKLPIADTIARDFTEFFFKALEDYRGDYVEAFERTRARIGDKYEGMIPGIRSFLQIWQHPECDRPFVPPKTRWFSRLGNLPWKAVGMGAIAAGIAMGVGLWFGREAIANWGENRGEVLNLAAYEAQQTGQIDRAIALYQKAAFWLRDGTPENNLAVLYGDILNEGNFALKYSKIAARKGNLNATAEVAALMLENPEVEEEEALRWVKHCLALSDNLPEDESGIRASCLILQGWIFYKEGLLKVALTNLDAGIEIVETNMNRLGEDIQPPILAYCLKALIFEKQADSSRSLAYWQNVLEHEKNAIPSHHWCMVEAHQRFN
ncbi:MAG: hypothetical protein J7647_10800 [Cyanobacteria bacterium SBLK]|nr:hypothetical protein [Cyanobacteria bacterium SBLK]